MNKGRYSIILGVIGLAFVLLDLFVLQSKMIAMYWVSPIAWIIPLFRDMPDVWKLGITYITTPVIYFLIGAFLDRTLSKKKDRQTN